MADGAAKAVETALLDTWSFGDSILPLIADKGPVTRGGDSVDMPYRGASTVNTSETASVASTSISVDTLTVNRPKFTNDEITKAQYAQLLNGNGNYASELARGVGGDLLYAIERDIIDYLIGSIAGAAVGNHINLAADAATDDDVNETEAALREIRGISNTGRGLFWLLSPWSDAQLRGVSQYAATQNAAQAGLLGLPMVGQLNNIPCYMHNGVPGRLDASRYSVATTAVTISSNVATATVAAGHGFVAGQQIYTTGLTTNVAQASPATVSSVTSTTVVFPLTASDGAMADGVGSILSASSYAMLCYGPWIGFATDGRIPDVSLVKREGNAGWTLQMFRHLGRQAHVGAVKILHLPDGV